VGEDAPVVNVRVVPIAAVAALALLATGCGGGGSSATPPVASATTTTASTATTARGALVAFSSCMRSHGMPSFPDPQQIGSNVKLTIHNTVGDNPRYQAALSACNGLLPSRSTPETPQQVHKRLEDALSFARCMRSHGVSRFPDPDAHGQLTVEMVQAQGIDVHSTAILHVLQTCLPASHGWLTAQKVQAAISRAGR
jgi:hypothetical protein